MISAASCWPAARADAHAVAQGRHRRHLGSETVAAPSRRAVCRRPRSRSPTDRRSRRRGPSARSVLTTVPPPSRSTAVRPLVAGRAPAGQDDRAGEVGDERRRAAAPPARSPSPPGSTRPRSITPTGRRAGRPREVVRHEQRRHLHLAQHLGQLARGARAGARVERGQRLVEQQRLRVAARAHARARRAGARRRRACAGTRSARLATPKRSSSSSARLRRCAPAQPAQREGDVVDTRSDAETARIPGTGSRSAAARARRRCRASVSSQTSSPHTTRPLSGRSRPAAIRSTLVLPAPDGPGKREASPGLHRERDVQLELAQRRARLNAQHGRRAPPRRPRA